MEEMNYFGHAALAVARKESPKFVLGAMLPDLYSMMRIRGGRVDDPDIVLGIDFHLKTDALFHQTETFVSLNRNTLNALRQRDVSRGPARACAHIGVEMLIDAVLIRNQDALEGYLLALEAGAASDALFEPHPLPLRARLKDLCQHLIILREAVHVTDKQRLTERLGRTLSDRARLRPSEQELEAIAEYLSANREVERQVPRLLQELQPLLEAPLTKTHPSSLDMGVDFLI